jgi:hypothetical protein
MLAAEYATYSENYSGALPLLFGFRDKPLTLLDIIPNRVYFCAMRRVKDEAFTRASHPGGLLLAPLPQENS